MDITINYGNTHSLINKLRREKDRAVVALENQSFPDLIDALFNFSITAFHIKDWLISQNKLNKEDVHSFMNGVPVLLACRDICNANKHFEITHYNPGDVSVSSTLTEITSVVRKDDGGVNVYGKADIYVSVNGEDYRLIEFMEKVIEVWNQFHNEMSGRTHQ